MKNILKLSVIIIFYLVSELIGQPVIINITNAEPIWNPNSNSLIQDGAIIHLIWVGPNGQIDLPIINPGQADNGQPGGDDVLINPVHTVGEGMPANSGGFFISQSAYQNQQSGVPAVGDYVYIRVFDSDNLVNAQYYGDGQPYQVTASSEQWYIVSLGNVDQPLPVELTVFEAERRETGIVLNWKTSSEINNLGFIIKKRAEYSSDFQIVASYEHFEQMQGAGNSHDEVEYSFVDENVLDGQGYFYALFSVDFNGESFFYDTLFVPARIKGLERLEKQDLPQNYELYPNYPNPFNPGTYVEFAVPRGAVGFRTTLEIYNLLGEKIRTLVNRELGPGYYKIYWDGQNDNDGRVCSGLYIYYLRSNSFRKAGKMILLR